MVLRDTDDRAGVVPDSRGRTDWLLGWVRVAGEHHRVATHQRARRGVAGDSHRLRGRLVCARPHGDDVPRFFLFEQESSAWVLPPRASRPCRARHRCAQDHRTGRSSRPKTIEGSRCGGVAFSSARPSGSLHSSCGLGPPRGTDPRLQSSTAPIGSESIHTRKLHVAHRGSLPGVGRCDDVVDTACAAVLSASSAGPYLLRACACGESACKRDSVTRPKPCR